MSLGAVSAVSLGTNDSRSGREHTDAMWPSPILLVIRVQYLTTTTAAQDPTTAVAATKMMSPTDQTLQQQLSIWQLIQQIQLQRMLLIRRCRYWSCGNWQIQQQPMGRCWYDKHYNWHSNGYWSRSSCEASVTGARHVVLRGRRATPVGSNTNNANNTVTVVSNDIPATNSIVTDGQGHIKTIDVLSNTTLKMTVLFVRTMSLNVTAK